MSPQRAQRGQNQQALRPSLGGFSTKIYLETDWDSDPPGFCLTGRGGSASPRFETLLELGPDITLRAALDDKGKTPRPTGRPPAPGASAR
jgi:hypothetical protein